MTKSGRKGTAAAAPRSAPNVAKATQSRKNVAGSRDPRCERTRTAILEAYVALCTERGDEFAGVSAICRQARINKATFYRHFEDKADLLERGVEGFFARIGDGLDPAPEEEGRTAASAMQRILGLFERIEEHARLLRPVLSGAAGSRLRKKAEDFFEEYIRTRRVLRLALPGSRYTIPRDMIPRALTSLSQPNERGDGDRDPTDLRGRRFRRGVYPGAAGSGR